MIANLRRLLGRTTAGKWLKNKLRHSTQVAPLTHAESIVPLLKQQIDSLTAQLDQSNNLLNLSIEQRNLAISQLDSAISEVSSHKHKLFQKENEVYARMTKLLSSLITQSGYVKIANLVRKDEINDKHIHVTIIYSAKTQQFHFEQLCHNLLKAEVYKISVYAMVSTGASGLLKFCSDHHIDLVEDGKYILGEPLRSIYTFGQDSPFGDMVDSRVYAPGFPGLSAADAIKITSAEMRRQRDFERYVESFIVINRTKLLIAFEDNAATDTLIWGDVCGRFGIPFAIIPFTLADEIEPAESHRHDPIYWVHDDNPFTSYMADNFPHWIYTYRDQRMCRAAGPRSLAAETLGFAPPQPWILNSSKHGIVVVESRAMREFYENLNFPSEKLALCGSFSDDILHSATQSASFTRAKLGVQANQKLLVCSVPPNQLTAIRSECDFQQYNSLIEFWLEQMTRLDGWVVAFSLHPSCPQTIRSTIERCGGTVPDLALAELIGACDLYVASVSSTIRWANACGKPTVNYDVYKYRYRDFTNCTGVFNTESAEQFKQFFKDLGDNPARLRLLSENAKHDSGLWGRIDGCSSERIMQFLGGLVARYAEGHPI